MSVEIIQSGKTIGSVKHKTFAKLTKELEALRRRTGNPLDAYGTQVLHWDVVKLLHDTLFDRKEEDVAAFRDILASALQRKDSVIFEGD